MLVAVFLFIKYMKTFKDLDFKKHSIAESGIERYQDAKQATEKFENNYGVSVNIARNSENLAFLYAAACSSKTLSNSFKDENRTL